MPNISEHPNYNEFCSFIRHHKNLLHPLIRNLSERFPIIFVPEDGKNLIYDDGYKIYIRSSLFNFNKIKQSTSFGLFIKSLIRVFNQVSFQAKDLGIELTSLADIKKSIAFTLASELIVNHICLTFGVKASNSQSILTEKSLTLPPESITLNLLNEEFPNLYEKFINNKKTLNEYSIKELYYLLLEEIDEEDFTINFVDFNSTDSEFGESESIGEGFFKLDINFSPSNKALQEKEKREEESQNFLENTSKDYSEIEKNFRDSLEREIERKAGNRSSELSDMFKYKSEIVRIDWKQALREFIGARLSFNVEYSYKRPSRLVSSEILEDRSIYLGKRIYTPEIPNIGILMDRSGSCCNLEDQSKFASNLEAIQKEWECKIILYAFDTKITSKVIIEPEESLRDAYKKNKNIYRQGGGTCFIDPLIKVWDVEFNKKLSDKSQCENLMPDVIVLLTDGCGDYPEESEYSLEKINKTLIAVTDRYFPPTRFKYIDLNNEYTEE